MAKFNTRYRSISRPRQSYSETASGAEVCKTRRLLLVQLLLMGLILTSCGTISVRFVSNPQVPPSSTTGTIVAVFLGTVSDVHGNLLIITTVNVVNAGLSSTLNLCGDQQDRFFINSVVRIDFTPSTPCFVLVNVFVLG